MPTSTDGCCLCAQAARSASVLHGPRLVAASLKAFRAPPPTLPRVPTQVNGMPAFRHQLMPGTQLRFDGEWKVLCAL